MRRHHQKPSWFEVVVVPSGALTAITAMTLLPALFDPHIYLIERFAFVGGVILGVCVISLALSSLIMLIFIFSQRQDKPEPTKI
ncbi:MAG: hypothetical protein WCV84_03250 [Patescibacteria group bacterium]